VSRNRWDGDWPPRTTPIRPADGIRAQSKRGAFASGPWAKRWIAVLEAFQLGTRLTRGRSYARQGQVTQIAIEPGGARAQVQGSRPKPYDVTIRLRQLDAAEWPAVGAAIADDVRLCAAVLAGDMPEDIERAFAAAGTSLFPASAKEMTTACTCPDWSNPCKHVAAVFYLIGEEFDRDPCLLFVLRGRARDDVRDLFIPQTVVEARPFGERPAVAERPSVKRVRKARTVPAPTIPSPEAFWGDAAAEPNAFGTHVEATSTDEPAVLKRAGNFPFWRADTALADAIVPIYNDASAFALNWPADHAQKRNE
jgi:uncharacterized Zn finger protein